jgi:uncharacterized protein (DUF58 family)
MYVSIRLALVAVASSVAAGFLPFPVWATLLVVDGSLAVLVVLDVVLAPRASRLSFERDSPAVSGIGRSDGLSIGVHNPLARPVEVALRDAAPASLHRVPKIHRAEIEAERWRTFDATVSPTRRGFAQLGPISVRTAGPLRLAGRQSRIASTARIKVYPALPGRAMVARRIRRARELRTGMRSSAFRGGGHEFDSLREYHPDDEFRRIDWAATARSGKPITRVYRQESDQQVMLLLDAGNAMAGSIEGTSRFEHAIDAGFALAELAAHVGDRVGMLAFGARVKRMIGPRGGSEQPRRILDLLFDVDPTLEAPDYPGAFATMLSRYHRRALLVLLTELTDERAMEPLFDALPALRARHLVVVAAVRDPSVAGLATSMPIDAETAYLKAAAAESLSSRRRAATRLQAMGVAVEDRNPGDLATAVGDRYLDIKSAGRL